MTKPSKDLGVVWVCPVCFAIGDKDEVTHQDTSYNQDKHTETPMVELAEYTALQVKLEMAQKVVHTQVGNLKMLRSILGDILSPVQQMVLSSSIEALASVEGEE